MIDRIKTYFIEQQWPLEVLGIVAFVVVFNVIIKGLLIWLHQHYEKRDSIWRVSFVDALFKPLSFYVWFFAIISIVYLLDQRLHKDPYFGNAPITLLVFGGIIALGWFAFRWKNRAFAAMEKQNYLEKAGLDASRIDVIDKILTVVIAFILLVWLLQAAGQGISAILTLGGIGAAAIGFASKEFIANFFGGFMIYLTRPFKIGDAIKLEGKDTMGLVEEIGWYMTRVRDFEKQPMYIPNSMFSQFILVNMTQRSHRRINEVVGIRYKDFRCLEGILQDIRKYLSEHPDFDASLPQGASFSAYGDSSLDMTIITYTTKKTFDEFNAIKEELLLKVYDIVTSHNADFAFPTMTIEKPE